MSFIPAFVPVAEAASQTCDVTTTANIVSPGTSVTISWATSGYSQVTLNGAPVAAKNGSMTITVTSHTPYRLEASNPGQSSRCVVSITIICFGPALSLSPTNPISPIATTTPVTSPVVIVPVVKPSPAPSVPAAKAYLSIMTEGFATALTSGNRTIPATANISELTWRSADAVFCEGRGFATGGTVSGEVKAGSVALALAPGGDREFALRCRNAQNQWSPWQEVRIIKEAAVVSNPNAAPSAPAIFGADVSTAAPLHGPVNQGLPFTFRSTDPDGDALLYRVDWDRNGLVDMLLPASGYVQSGTAVADTYQWTVPGTYTFRVQAVDDERNVSNWTEHTISIANNPPVRVQPAPPRIFLTVDRELVRTGESTGVTVLIQADYDVVCTLSGLAGGTVNLRHAGAVPEKKYSYQTANLRAMQIVKAVCTPDIAGLVMPTEVRERRISVASGMSET